MANTVQLKKNGQIVYPVTDRSCVIGLEEGPVMSCRYAWDGTTTPDVTKIPAGVTVEYNSNTYTGTLAASASTVGYQYLVYNTTSTEFDRYATDATGGSYAWKAMGDTTIQSPDIADNLTTNDPTKALSAKQGKILNEEVEGLEAKVTELTGDVSLNGDNDLTLVDNKTSSGDLTYFKSPLIVGNRYRIKNISSGSLSLYLFDQNKTSLGAIAANLAANAEITFTHTNSSAYYIGGWINDLVYALKIDLLNTKLYEADKAIRYDVAADILNRENDAVLVDNKADSGDITYFPSPFEIGETYIITNENSLSCSLALFDSGKNNIRSFGTIVSGGSVTYTHNNANVAFVGGWVNASTYTLKIVKEKTKLDIKIDSLDDKKADFQPIEKDFSFNDGYIHYNASAGVFSSEDYQYSDPIKVQKGTKIYMTIVSGGSYTAIAKYNDGVYSSLASSGEYTSQKDGHAFFEYVVQEDCYISLCGKKSEFSAYIVRNHNYVGEEVYQKIERVAVSGDFNFFFPVKSGRKYRVKNEGENNASFVLKMNPSGAIVYRVNAEEISDRTNRSDLPANSWCIFTAQIDTFYVVGYSNSGTTVSIEDITTISSIDKETETGMLSSYHNMIFESREGRVSSTQYPNGTKWAIQDAARNQYDRIRFTVRKTTDGYYFLCHDNTINAVARNSDGSAISSPVTSDGKTLAELNAYDWGIKYGSKYAGMNVPLLSDALYYSSLYNLGVTIEFSFQLADEDYDALFSLFAKYGVMKKLVLGPLTPALASYFNAKTPYVGFWWAGSYEQFNTQKENLKSYLTGGNDIYIYNTPYTDYPSDEYVADIYRNGFFTFFSNVFNIEDFINTAKNGITLIDVANVPFVKSTLRDYVDSLIN